VCREAFFCLRLLCSHAEVGSIALACANHYLPDLALPLLPTEKVLTLYSLAPYPYQRLRKSILKHVTLELVLAVGSASALVSFIRVLCSMRTQISRCICTFTHHSRHRHHQISRSICTFTHCHRRQVLDEHTGVCGVETRGCALVGRLAVEADTHAYMLRTYCIALHLLCDVSCFVTCNCETRGCALVGRLAVEADTHAYMLRTYCIALCLLCDFFLKIVRARI
jgi:hypothetical protein